ncbi:MAG: MFS transporter [Actinomycetia bacterium]|nr:MFS transporter [Actinomycetes bacterium]
MFAHDAAVNPHASVQRRTMWVLFAGTIPAGAAMSGAFAAAATLGEELTGSDRLGTLAAACVTVGGALSAVPIARLMSRGGRRPGLRTAWISGAGGSALCALAALAEIYALLLPGLVMVGAGSAGTLAARYAAADLALPEQRAKAIGVLVWGGTFGSVLGPIVALQGAGAASEALGMPELAGPYFLSIVLFSIAAFSIERFLHPDPLVVAGGLDSDAAADKQRPPFTVTISRIMGNAQARLAVAAMIVGHGVMVGVMVATPLHMKDGHQALSVVGQVISLHVLGMYAFAPLIGRLVDRVGPTLVVAFGGVILAAGAEMAARTDAPHAQGVAIGLFLVGIGWNFGIIAASSLLTSAFDLHERVAAQGAADLMMTSAGAAAGLSSGFVLEAWGYQSLSHNAGLFGVALTVLAMFMLLPRRRLAAG